MTDFSKEWLALREDTDKRAINRDIADALAGRFALRTHVAVVDLGSGTGANLRRTAPLLPNRQSWTLIDNNPGLLAAAQRALGRWADTAHVEMATDGARTLHLEKNGATIDVTLRHRDLAQGLARALEPKADLVTAAAFFDLTSEIFIREVARHVADIRATFYAALTYNGIQRWMPHRPADNQMTAAFHRHQMRDKGFGPAAGPTAAAHLADQFRLNGYSVLEGESPWLLERTDRMLIEELIAGHAHAVAETGAVDAKTIETWVKVQRTGAVVGHSDTLAVPAD